jgi:hypothetical protein
MAASTTAARAGRYQGYAAVYEADHAVDAHGLRGFGQHLRQQGGGEVARQPRRARSGRAEQEEMMVRTLARASAARFYHAALEALAADLATDRDAWQQALPPAMSPGSCRCGRRQRVNLIRAKLLRRH